MSAGGSKDKKTDKAVAEDSSSEETVSEKEDAEEKDAEEQKPEEPAPEPEISLEEIMEQAQELNYKDIMRNPENYTGQYFYVTVKILTAESGSFFSSYDRAYKAYTNDDYNMWLGDMIYLLDNRNTESEEYLKILEDDIVKVYGRFDDLVETKNALNGTKGEEMSLQILYAELISE